MCIINYFAMGRGCFSIDKINIQWKKEEIFFLLVCVQKGWINRNKCRKRKYYFVTSRGVIPVCCLKTLEKYWGDLNPHWKLISLMDISEFLNNSMDLLMRI